MTTFNIAPYFDDFDESKNYHQILFRPGFPVQSRELTQIQSIMQSQIKKFGNHIFKNGTVVTGGETDYDTNVKSVRIDLNVGVVGSSLVGKVIKGSTYNVEGRCVHFENNIAYIKFTSVSNINPSIKEFQNSENLSYYNDDTSNYVSFGTTVASSAVQDATICSISDGVFYWGGYFVTVLKQVKAVSETSKTPSAVVTLDAVESVVDDADDETLRDPALGYSNENAPGAHRYKLSLELSIHTDKDNLTENSIILFELKSGNIERLYNTTSYAEIMKMIARRTYEESGNYIVRPYEINLTQNGGNTALLDFVARRGVAFVGGYELDNKINAVSSTVKKARDFSSVNNSAITLDFGNYFYTANNKGLPKTWANIEFRDDSITTPGTLTGAIIGYAIVRSVEKTALSGVYKVFVSDVEFAPGKNISNAGSFAEVTSTNQSSGNIVGVIQTTTRSGTFDTTNEIVSQSLSTRVVIPVAKDGETLYCKKKPGAYSWLIQGDVAKQTTSNAQANVVQSTLIVEADKSTMVHALPKTAIKSVSDFAYDVTKQITITTDGVGAGTTNLPAGQTISDSTKTVAWVQNTTTFVTVTGANGASSVSITGGPVSSTIIVSVCVRKSTATQKSKTLTTGSLSGVTIANKTLWSLGAVDATEITSIIDGSSKDHKASYQLIKNEKNGSISGSYISLKAGAVPPSGSVTINFKYYDNGTGDFAVVDSYPNVDSIHTFKDSSGSSYVLQNCLDFRPKKQPRSFIIVADTTASNATITFKNLSNGLITTGMTIYGPGVALGTTLTPNGANNTQATLSANATTSNTNAVYVVGYDAATFSSVVSGTSDAVSAKSQFVCDYQYYLPRVDTIVLTRDGVANVIEGISSETPVAPVIEENEYRMKLCDLYVPAYTYTPKSVIITKYNRRRYTMSDIGRLDSRLTNVEEVTALTMLEQNLMNSQIVDPVTGLNRFKSGFGVDNFRDHAVIDFSADSVANIDYSTGVLSSAAKASPLRISVLTDGNSSNYTVKDGNLMVAYTEEVLIDQPMASRGQNVNPFAAFKWIGTVKLTPNSFFWVEENRLADIVINRTNSTNVDGGSRVVSSRVQNTW